MFSNVPQEKVPSMVPYWAPMLYSDSREQTWHKVLRTLY